MATVLRLARGDTREKAWLDTGYPPRRTPSAFSRDFFLPVAAKVYHGMDKHMARYGGLVRYTVDLSGGWEARGAQDVDV